MISTAHASRIRSVATSMSWMTVDQVLSSLSNVVITLAVTRGAGVDGLGRFSVAFAAYLTVLGFTRSLVSEPMLTLPRAGAEGRSDRDVEGCAVTLTLGCAVLGAGVVGGIGLLLEHVELVVVAVMLPVTLLHDMLRYQAFRRMRAQLAAVLDGGWLLGSVLAWPLVSSSPLVAPALGCWAGAALIGIAAVWRVLRPSVVGMRVALRWWQADCRAVAPALVLDSLMVTALLQALVVVLVAADGAAALGLLRAAQVYFNPLGVVLTAVGVMAVPRLAQRGGVASTALAFRLSAGLTLLGCAACGVIVLAEPLLHTVLFGDVVDVPGWLMIPLAVQVIAAAASSGLLVATKARRRGADIARSRLVATVIGMAVLIPATSTFGLRGAVWALAVQGVVYLIDQAYRVIRTGMLRPPVDLVAAKGSY
jgi:O-antigen/teichoic acid export membrane protein